MGKAGTFLKTYFRKHSNSVNYQAPNCQITTSWAGQEADTSVNRVLLCRFYEFGLETWRFLPQGNREAADAGKFSLRVDLGEILAKYGKLEAQPRPVPL